MENYKHSSWKEKEQVHEVNSDPYYPVLTVIIHFVITTKTAFSGHENKE